MGQVYYTKTHEWLEIEDGLGIAGVTDRLSLEFGKIVYIEMPEVGDEFEQEEMMGISEFVTGDRLRFHAPVSGEVFAINEELADETDLLNNSAEGDGWICKLKIESLRELETLMSREDYELFEEDDYVEDEPYDEDDLVYEV